MFAMIFFVYFIVFVVIVVMVVGLILSVVLLIAGFKSRVANKKLCLILSAIIFLLFVIAPLAIFYDVRNSESERLALRQEEYAESLLLSNAVAAGDVYEVERLLKDGKNPNENSWSLLFTICDKKNYFNREDVRIVELLLMYGADVEQTSGINEFTPLIALCYNDNVAFKYDIAELLIEYGADVNQAGGIGDSTPLMIICSNEKADYCINTVELFIENGADVNAVDDYGQTSFMRYCLSPYLYNDCLKIPKLLLENGADINIKDNNGQTVLSRTGTSKKRFNYDDLIEFLIENGAE
ncbi:MAG: ankyrin repeat domain-containing protein [Oscillospiraceae bacterium]|nr:ankyrin repeat domain-containing protein [Oscillospiraceae bacterium]